jgi:hypothetical protein
MDKYSKPEDITMTSTTTQKIDRDLVRKATEVAKLNLSKDLFRNTDKKTTIQYLFTAYYTKAVDFYNDSVTSIDVTTLNGLIRKIRNESGSRLKDIYDYKVEGEYGPGEVLFYLLTKDGSLGGKSSRGADLFLPSNSYEIKAVRKYVSTGYYYNFKLGDTDFSSLVTRLRNIKGIPKSGDIQKSILDKLRSGQSPFTKDNQIEFNSIEEEFQIIVKSYFKNSVIFISSADNNLAEIYDIKTPSEIKRAKFLIETFSYNTLKPMVKF